MGLNALAFLFFASLGLAAHRPCQEDAEWGAVWDRLALLEREDSDAAERRSVLEELGQLANELPDSPRRRLLSAQLLARAGQDTRLAAERLLALPEWPFIGREAWLAAEVMPAGEARVRAVLRALEGAGVGPDPVAELSREALLVAWNTGVDEARALRFEEGALPIQRILHERYAAAWSAMDLAHSLSRMGEVAEADRLLAEAIEREAAAGRPTAQLWSNRGLIAIGRGDEARARDYLGRALVQGSDDANLMLSRLDLDAGRLSAARRGFRASILSPNPSAWALRGWGTTLLPPSGRAPNPKTDSP